MTRTRTKGKNRPVHSGSYIKSCKYQKSFQNYIF